jgi:hypothetical protein
MNASFMSLEQHERGIHVVELGAGEAGVTGVLSAEPGASEPRWPVDPEV